MKKYLKKFWIVKKAHLFWMSYKNNPDILDRIQRRIFQYKQKDTPLQPPTAREVELIQNLQTRIEKLPIEIPNSSTPGPERMWINYKNELRTKILTEDPRNFLKWNVVANTMAGTLPRRDYLILAKLPFWKDWGKAIATLPLINQCPYFKFPQIDGTTLAHVYHLAQLKLHLNKEVSDMDLIIDFGGGYGTMCAAVFALGFKGEYTIFDWPEFLLLQEFYLKLHDIDTSKIKFISTLPELKKEIGERKGLLIATWSISETSEEFRNEFFRTINPKYYIIAYQRSVWGVNNHVYFQKFANEHPGIAWKDFPIFNLPGDGNRYLLGGLKD